MINGHTDPELDVKILSTNVVRVAGRRATHEFENSRSRPTAALWAFSYPCLALTSKCLHPNSLYPTDILLGVKSSNFKMSHQLGRSNGQRVCSLDYFELARGIR
jgi:hypothetical protein